MSEMLSVALKEWDLQITAMLAGDQAFLLRKGGILESDNQFEMEHARFLFFPTFVHQDPHMIKLPWRIGITSVREEPEKVQIRSYGEVAAVFEVPQGRGGAKGGADRGRRALDLLSDLYVWDAPLLDMRFAYRPEKPLYLVVVRAFALSTPVTIPNTIEYAGCKSWVPLAQSIDVSGAQPALPGQRLQAIVDRVRHVFENLNPTN
jgi:hypothetical protein